MTILINSSLASGSPPTGPIRRARQAQNVPETGLKSSKNRTITSIHRPVFPTRNNSSDPLSCSSWLTGDADRVFGHDRGLEALRSRKGGGPKPKISEAELQQLPEYLEKGPEAYGFRGDVWTRARVGAVIEEEFGVSYSDTHIGRLPDKIGWSRQKPAERASQRNEDEIEAWKEETWPELKKKPPEKGAPSSS